tara:strand:- start:96 stop:710 length:615 start_codon:yes stop_codon:yes gene_type:complete
MVNYPEAQAKANETPAYGGGKITTYQGSQPVVFKAKKLAPSHLASRGLPASAVIWKWSATACSQSGTQADREKFAINMKEYFANNKAKILEQRTEYLEGQGFASYWERHKHKHPDAPKRGPRPTAHVLQQPPFAALMAASAAGDMHDDEVASQLVCIVGLVRVDEYEHSSASPWARTQHMDLHTLMTIISGSEPSPPCRMRTAA